MCWTNQGVQVGNCLCCFTRFCPLWGNSIQYDKNISASHPSEVSVFETASISRIAGRQGIRTRSADFAASNAVLSECGAVSRMRIWQPASFTRFISFDNRLACAESTTGASIVLLSDHFAAEACGSRSMIVVLFSLAAATAKCNAMVVFPEPPFWLMTAIVFIYTHMNTYNSTGVHNRTCT